jgi:8-oxo-dGTP pyrophosphatase MutT (NUDIX family)
MSPEEPEKSAVPRLAATLVLLRESSRGLEALLLQRLAKMAFAGGEWVFPGGAIDAADGAESILRCTPDGTGLSAVELSRRVAACRETFEESGVLLARYRRSQGVAGPLSQLARAGAAIGDVLSANDLLLNVDQLAPWSNWITPSYAPRRFDTHFFAAAMPAGQEVRFDARESQAARWVPVADPALVAPGAVSLPALFTLREIASHYRQCRSLAGVLASASTAAPASIMLKLLRTSQSLLGLMPWDPAYRDAPGEGTACSAAMAERFREFPARFEMDPLTGAPRNLRWTGCAASGFEEARPDSGGRVS